MSESKLVDIYKTLVVPKYSNQFSKKLWNHSTSNFYRASMQYHKITQCAEFVISAQHFEWYNGDRMVLKQTNSKLIMNLSSTMCSWDTWVNPIKAWRYQWCIEAKHCRMWRPYVGLEMRTRILCIILSWTSSLVIQILKYSTCECIDNYHKQHLMWSCKCSFLHFISFVNFKHKWHMTPFLR